MQWSDWIQDREREREWTKQIAIEYSVEDEEKRIPALRIGKTKTKTLWMFHIYKLWRKDFLFHITSSHKEDSSSSLAGYGPFIKEWESQSVVWNT